MIAMKQKIRKIDIFKFPRNTINKILHLLDSDSLLQMRKVSRAANNFLRILLGTRKTSVRFFQVYKQLDFRLMGPTILRIELETERQCVLWKLCLIFEVGKQKSRNSDLPETLTLRARAENDLINILEYLDPHTRMAEFETVSFRDICSETLVACSDFFDGKLIADFRFYRKNQDGIDFAHWVRKWRKWNLKEAIFDELPKNEGSFNFLLQLSDIVERLSFSMDTTNFPHSIIRDILSRKVQHLKICGKIEYSLADFESLIKIFNNLGKKLRFEFCTSIRHNEAQIGMFKVKTRFRSPTEISHIEMDD